MIMITNRFARIGRSFPSEVYEPLYKVSLAARAERRLRAGSWNGSRAKIWRGSGEAVTLPLRLPH